MAIININQPVQTYNGTNGAYTFYLEVLLNSQNIENNTSNITINHYAKGNNGWGYNGFSSPYSQISVNNTVKKTTTVASIPTSGAKTLIGTWTGDITHNSDGTMSITVTARYNPDTSSYYYVPKDNTLSGTSSLTTIPRASEVAVSNETISVPSGSINYTITSKADFWHKVTWTLGSTTNTSNKGEINATTSTFSIGRTLLLNALPTQTSGSLTITVETYQDSGYTTLVGSKSASATITINTSAIKPTIMLGNIAINTSPHTDITVPVAGYSTVKSNFAASPGNGASGVTTYFSVSHGDLNMTTSTSANGTVTSNTLPSSTADYTYTLTAYTKDGRGAVSSTATRTITVYGYQAPTATLSAYRTETSSSTTEDGAGAYVYVTFSGAVRSTVNNQNAIVSTACTYTGSISGTATNGAHYRLADSQNATFTLVVTDKVTSTTVIQQVSSASYPIDLYDDGNGTVGVGLGGVAEANNLGVHLNLHLYYPFKIVIHKQNGTTETHDITELFS